MIGIMIESEYDGYFYNPSPVVSHILKEKYDINIREEYEDAIAQYLEFQMTNSPTTNKDVLKDLFLFDGNFVIVRFREKLSDAYI